MESKLEVITKAIEMSLNLKIIGTKTMEHWQKKINDVKYMTVAWRSKDSNR